jgi:hypothetical protein
MNSQQRGIPQIAQDQCECGFNAMSSVAEHSLEAQRLKRAPLGWQARTHNGANAANSRIIMTMLHAQTLVPIAGSVNSSTGLCTHSAFELPLVKPMFAMPSPVAFHN